MPENSKLKTQNPKLFIRHPAGMAGGGIVAETADLRVHLRRQIRAALVASGWGDAGPPESHIVLELPREFAHGDLACPVAFGMAKAMRRAPRDIASELAARLEGDPLISKVEIAGGGYLNFFFGESVWQDMLRNIQQSHDRYGRCSRLAGERILVEFVSANPTGPLLVANIRSAAFGEALCRCLEAAGAVVEREYYVNDAGSQVRNLALSVEARWRALLGEPAEIPQDGYHGEYVKELAAQAREHLTDDTLHKDAETRVQLIRDFSVRMMVSRQEHELHHLGVQFDRWFHEHELHAAGLVASAFEALKAKGVVFEREGAQWFQATRSGDEKDRVLIRSDGQPTYVLPDVAYHRHKFSRGYTRVITIVGADHQTEMNTLQCALNVLDEGAGRLEVIIVQFVNLKRGSEKVMMSKRAGAVVLLADLVDEVGVDAARFLFLLRAPSSHLDFDLELAKSTSMENPVYYIQYAHARLCSLLDHARSRGLPEPAAETARPALLAEPEARLVLRKLVRFPFVVEKAAVGRAPHLLTHEVLELAQAVHQFYTRHRVVGAGSGEVQQARLALVAAARQTVANGLALLGVSAPSRM